VRVRRYRENSIRSYGVNPWSPNLLITLREDLMWLGNERIALLLRLRAIWQQWQVTRSKAIGSDISDAQKLQLGTTIGDIDSNILDMSELDEDPSKIKDELETRFEELTEGSGLRVTTGEAGGTTVEGIPEDKALESENKSLWDRVRYEQKIAQLLDSIEILLDTLVDLKQKNEATRERINDKWQKLIGYKTPNPEATDGNYTPKHPIYSPYDKWLGSPRAVKPLDDPRMEEQFGPSRVLRGRDKRVGAVAWPAPDRRTCRRYPTSTSRSQNDCAFTKQAQFPVARKDYPRFLWLPIEASSFQSVRIFESGASFAPSHDRFRPRYTHRGTKMRRDYVGSHPSSCG
jgi:hypothetical protein